MQPLDQGENTRPRVRSIIELSAGNNARDLRATRKGEAKDTPKNNCYVSALSSGLDGVVPFWVEGVASYRQFCHFGGGDLDAFLVGPRIEYALDLQARLCRGGADQLDDGDAIHQRFSSPVLGNVAEEAMLNLVPFRGAWRQVMDVNGEVCVIGELLQLNLP